MLLPFHSLELPLVIPSIHLPFIQSFLSLIFAVVGFPMITGQPAPHDSILPGRTVSFAVIAAGDNLMYQWQKDGANITAGANSAAYIIPSVAESDEGEYQCIVSNDAGNTTSDVAQLTVDECIMQYSNYLLCSTVLKVRRSVSHYEI